MKKILIYLSIAVSSLTISCSRAEMEQPGAATAEWGGEGAAIRLGAKSAEAIPTKAERPGDDDGSFNENKVYTLDYFIYDVDPSAEGNQSKSAVLNGRLTFSGIEPTTEESAKANARVVDLSDYFGDENNTCYVYVIANLPGSDDSATNYFALNNDGKIVYYASADAEGTVIGTTWTDLQAVKIITDFKNSLTEGKFKAQKSFVMSGLSDMITLSGKGADDVIVDLSRLASKVSIKTNVAKLFDKYTYNTVTKSMEYMGSYFPNVDHIQIYLNYVDPQGTIDGALDTYQQAYYFSYNRYAYIPSVNPNGSFTSKVVKKNPDGSIAIDDEGNAIYEDSAEYPAFEVTGTPFYSYPTEWDTRDANAPFIKIIIPWIEYEVVAGIRNQYTVINQNGTVETDPENETYKALISAILDNNFPATSSLTVGETSYAITRKTTADAISKRNGDEYYYKISIPAWKNPEKDKEACALQANNWYHINLDISVLGSETDDAAMTIDGSTMGIMVCDWGNPREAMGGDLDGGRYLSVAQKEFTINAVNSITIPVISSHTLTAQIVSREVWVNGAWSTSWTTSTGDHSTSGRGTVTPDGTSSVTLTNALSNTVNGDMDCYKFRFVIDISQKNSDQTTTGALTERVTVYQNPPIYVDEYPGDYAFVNGYYGHLFINGGTTAYYRGTGGHGTSGNSGNVAVGYGNMTRNTNDQKEMVVISISALNSSSNTYEVAGTGAGTYTYLITDPRVNTIASSSLYDYNTNYTNTGDNTTVDWPATDIKVGSTATDAPGRNFIAPKFMISSTWGRNPGMQGSINFAQPRCATYQEAGYPAGRWRLPTEAEACFIASLQKYEFIDLMFNTNTSYALSNGRGLTVSANANTIGTNYRSLRCVYDLWYWGDEPYTETHDDAEKWQYIIAPGDNKLN